MRRKKNPLSIASVGKKKSFAPISKYQNIWSDFDNIDIFDLKRSIGFGFRLNMPMLGVIGYDIGYGFDNHNDDIKKPWGWEQHLIFGVPLN